MKHILTRSLFLLALVTLASFVSSPSLTAATTTPAPEIAAAPVCSAELVSGDLALSDPALGALPSFLRPITAQAATGCSTSKCDASCRAQGYDYGVCLSTYCICRFYYP